MKSNYLVETYNYLKSINEKDIINYSEFLEYISLEYINDFDVLVSSLDQDFKNFINSNNSLFHYTTYETLDKILETKSLKYSFLSSQSDPKEFVEILFPYLSYIVGETENPETKWDNLNKNAKDKFLNELQIICLSSNTQIIEHKNISAIQSILSKRKNNVLSRNLIDLLVFSPGYDKHRMWDSYADKFKGVCLVFDKRLLCEASSEDSINEFVNYTKKFEIARADINKSDYDNFENSKRYFFQKHIDYRDESEFRMLIQSGKQKYLNISKALKAVIFGDRVVDKQEMHSNLITKRDSSGINFKILKQNANGLHSKGFYLELDDSDFKG